MSLIEEQQLFDNLLVYFAVVAALVFVTTFMITAPYGRHQREGWGPSIPARWAWVIMESPNVLIVGGLFYLGDRHSNPVAIVFMAMWMLHYIHRSYIYPFQAQMSGKTMPLSVFFFAIVFTSFNAYLNGRYLFSFGPILDNSWFGDPRFLINVALFATGFVANRQSDGVLRALREPGETGYKIPYGGLYRWVSCPNYLSEIVMWGGWAVATWCWPAALFAIWTLANLAPRARAHHQWYQQEFPDYPLQRKALIPGLW
ncbi:MAG TPA: DUF1295 domain-containing protein [Myxococcales bacterium]|nr:DUF1295 domain-containing protein [Myxococcales bacterium]